MGNLVIVESPSKSKTIEKYLGSNYKVVSSKGHVRDLATTGKYGLGIDIENDFKPNYEFIRGKKKVVTDLKKLAKESDMVYLASDPDREGEAIAWHLKDSMNLKDDKYDRVVFNEITKDKVLEAFNSPRKIDYDLVRSQETRRILDRIIGFRLSKLMQSKTGGKSAGRVQSVALKLIVDLEEEIKNFVPEEYYTITAHFNDFDSELFKYGTKDIEIKTNVEADEILEKLNKSFKIESVEKKDRLKKSHPVFTTSTLQQEASTKLGFNAKKTMQIAQKLYEGIKLEHEYTGLITYMRTDSIRLSDDFVKKAYGYIANNFGNEYVGYVKSQKEKDNVQDAHEGIRPTDINRTPELIKDYLTNDEYKLYSLIYYRALASLMKDATCKTTTIILDNNNYKFKTTGSILVFDGYLKVYSRYEDNTDTILPPLDEYKSNVILSNSIEKEQHFTKPKSRYTEAKLIKELEELGIGRPSTYAKIIDTLKEREYVVVVDKKFQPTEVGILTTHKLQEFFSNLINVKYTANMEKELDEIADGEVNYITLLKDFYKEFEPMVKYAYDNMEKKEAEKTGEVCPECGSDLVLRKGKYGMFTACSNYPNCKYVKKEEKKVVKVMKCPNCDGDIVEKKTRKGKVFYGCSNYPKCSFAVWDKPIEEKCPDCGGVLLETKNGIKCNSCEYKR
jgi:DNA topoisomerase-1